MSGILPVKISFNHKTGQNFKQFERLEEKDKKFLVKFSTAWDIEFAVNEKIDLHKMADLIREGFTQDNDA